MRQDKPPESAAPRLSAGTRTRLTAPSSGPLYEGHFPGRPILPGVGLLDLALRALARGVSPALLGIENLRLRRLVVPGDVLTVEAQELDPDGRARIEVRRAAEVVANGVVVLGQPSTALGAAATDQERRRASSLPDLDDLLPHRPPMRLVEGVASEFEDGVECAVRVPRQCAFDGGGTAPALVALEMAAQSAAVCEALRRGREGANAGAPAGYLVGARDVRFARSLVPVGETLFATVRLTGIALPLCMYAFEVSLGNEVVSSGTVSTWLTATDA